MTTPDPEEGPLLLIVTGVMASGKSTVAQALAERLPRSVHLRGDAFRRMIVHGRADMGPEPSAEAFAQLRARYRAAARVAAVYRAEGFAVVYQDVAIGPILDEVVSLHDRPLHLVVLCPSPEVIASRESTRAKRGYGRFAVEQLDRVLREQTPRIGRWLDTSQLSVAATVDTILADLTSARVR